jgi:hypothetical protein
MATYISSNGTQSTGSKNKTSSNASSNNVLKSVSKAASELRSSLANTSSPSSGILDSNQTNANLKNAISGSSSTPSISSQISSMYDSSAKSQVAALKAAIQKSIAEQKNTIKTANQTYQPMRNNSEVQRYNDLRTTLEQSANAGDRGGVGRQAALETQTAADNRLNDINLQQQNLIDTANQNIADIRNSESLQEQQVNSDSAAAKLQALISQQQTDQAQQRQDAINTLGAYSSDYKAYANQLQNDGDPSNDWLIPYVLSNRQTKLSDQAAAQAAAEQQDFENMLKQQQVNYQTNKPYYNPKTGSSSSSTKKYTASQIQTMYKNGWIDEATAKQMLGI